MHFCFSLLWRTVSSESVRDYMSCVVNIMVDFSLWVVRRTVNSESELAASRKSETDDS